MSDTTPTTTAPANADKGQRTPNKGAVRNQSRPRASEENMAKLRAAAEPDQSACLRAIAATARNAMVVAYADPHLRRVASALLDADNVIALGQRTSGFDPAKMQSANEFQANLMQQFASLIQTIADRALVLDLQNYRSSDVKQAASSAKAARAQAARPAETTAP